MLHTPYDPYVSRFTFYEPFCAEGLKMNYQEWEGSIPEAIRGDSLWKAKVYRLALFAADFGWQDDTSPAEDKRTRSLADQLYRSLGSNNANDDEEDSHGTSN